jgi:hypothetical protein
MTRVNPVSSPTSASLAEKSPSAASSSQSMRKGIMWLLRVASVLFMFLIGAGKSLSIVMVKLQNYMAIDWDVQHATILKVTDLLANVPLQTFGNVPLKNGHGSIFLNGHERTILPSEETLQRLHEAVKNGTYLVYRDTKSYSGTLAESNYHQATVANDPFHEYWLHVPPVNEGEMTVTLYQDSETSNYETFRLQWRAYDIRDGRQSI